MTPRMISLTITCVFVLFAVSAEARISNVQSALFDVDKDGMYLNSDMAYNWTQGTTDMMQLSFALGTRWLREPHLVYFSASGALGLKDDERFTNRYYGHLRYRYRIHEMVMAETFAQAEYNEFRRILARVPIGVGPRIEYALGSNQLVQMALGTSYMFELMHLSADKNENNVRYSDSLNYEYNHRWNNYFALRLNLPILSVGSTVYVQPRFDHFADYMVLWESDVTFKITEGFTISMDYTLFHDSRPPESVLRRDSEFKTVFSVQLGPWFSPADKTTKESTANQ